MRYNAPMTKLSAILGAVVAFIVSALIAVLGYLYLDGKYEDERLDALKSQRKIYQLSIDALEVGRHALQKEVTRGNTDNADLRRRMRQGKLPSSGSSTSGYLRITPYPCDAGNLQRADGRSCRPVDDEKLAEIALHCDLVRAEAIAWRAWYPEAKKAVEECASIGHK